jgi:hypothetical protein
MSAPNSQEGSDQQAVGGLKAAEIALSDPLKAETRKARLYLLGVSLVGITIVRTGLVPQEITTLGITFGEADRRSLLSMLALVIVYFAFAFAIYGVSDFIAWRYAYSNVHWSELRTEVEVTWNRRERAKEAQAKIQREKQAVHTALAKAMMEARKVLRKSQEDVPDVTSEMVESLPEELRTEIEELQRNLKQALEKELESNVWQYPVSIDSRESGLDALSLVNPEVQRAIARYSTFAPTVSWVRALFEFLLPLLVGFYASYTLLSA